MAVGDQREWRCSLQIVTVNKTKFYFYFGGRREEWEEKDNGETMR